MYFFLGG